MKNPLVSILIPTYNQPEFFRQALESALAQTYKNIEIIVSDDSTDDQVQKVFEEYLDCGRNIKYLKHDVNYRDESIGDRVVMNLENLLEHANGEFINILFHDDLIYPTKIERMMEFFDDRWKEQIAIVSSLRDIINADGKQISKPHDILKELNIKEYDGITTMPGEAVGRLLLMVCGNFIGELSTVLIRRKDFFKPCVNKFSTGYFLGVRDRSMWDISTYLDICKDNRGLAFIREPLSAFRMAGGNQNTYNGTVRIELIVDWLAIATSAYLQNFYIHDRLEFNAACQYWLFIANKMLSFFERYKDASISIDVEIFDEIIRAVESVEQKNFELTFDIGKAWIRKYSSKTFDMMYLS